jgi:hypothetical protein
MNRNGNETESFAGNFVASDEQGLFFEVPYSKCLGGALAERWRPSQASRGPKNQNWASRRSHELSLKRCLHTVMRNCAPQAVLNNTATYDFEVVHPRPMSKGS